MSFIPINILDLIWDISGRGEEKIFSHGHDNKTIYLGKGNGRVKIYNKKKESDLAIAGNMTRIEISTEVEDFDIRKIKLFKFTGSFPNIYINQYVYSLSDYEEKNSTLLAILYAVQNGFPIRNLTRRYRDKLKDLLEGGYKINFDEKEATGIIRKNIFYYFLNTNKTVHFM